MPKPMIRIHDVENDTVIDREMTAAEIAALKASNDALTALENAVAAKATEKAAVLAKLGLDEEEVAALLA